jgi:hypothetical protein
VCTFIMRAIPVGPNRQLFITAKLWKTLEYVHHGLTQGGVRAIGGQGRGNGLQALNLLFPRVQLNVTRITSAKIGKK